MAQNKNKVSTARVHALKKCGEIRQGPHCVMYIREYPDFGDTIRLPSPVVQCNEGVNIFPGYVYGSARKVRCRLRACPQRIVIFTSLTNNLMLAETTGHRTGTCALYTHRRPFSKDLLSRFPRYFWYTRWLHAHTFCDGGHQLTDTTETAADSTSA